MESTKRRKHLDKLVVLAAAAAALVALAVPPVRWRFLNGSGIPPDDYFAFRFIGDLPGGASVAFDVLALIFLAIALVAGALLYVLRS